MDSREELIALFGDRNNNGGFIRDLCFTVFRNAGRPNLEDGGKRDWANDTLPAVNAGIEKIRAIVAALATPSPEAAGSAEAPVAWLWSSDRQEPVLHFYPPSKNDASFGWEALPLYDRRQNFRAGIEAAIAAVQDMRPSGNPTGWVINTGLIDAAYAKVILVLRALAPPAGAGEVKSMDTAPSGYKPLPDGVRCRCIRMWQSADGKLFCCNGSGAPPPLPDAVKGWNPDMGMAPHDGSEVCCLAPEYDGPIMLRWYKHNALGTEAWQDWDGDTYNPTCWFALPAAPEGA